MRSIAECSAGCTEEPLQYHLRRLAVKEEFGILKGSIGILKDSIGILKDSRDDEVVW